MAEPRAVADDECCDVAERPTHELTSDAVESDVAVLSALGNDTRYEVLRLLAAADGDVCACELEPSLPVSQSAVSQALSRLYDAGLVDRRKSGRWRFYAPTDAAEVLLSSLDSLRGDGR
jgi:ArsR family transcriptional regulator